ncbi:MAG: 16S rRNA (cytosine(1402)-N(4))-methyltransferase RsmH [Deferribacteraceae bacterium]|jgi:16S rRNA (cytosine1402-N4)-methyltransferase|nr:16S rRNA (cytosine(1402)-N(4))-methyltransferase RsmH [Deferribacteraceae bacterium]
MHLPVLRGELINSLNIMSDGVYVDCTGGGGGHAEFVRKQLTTGRLVILDRDVQAVERLKEKFYGDSQVNVVYANFRYISSVLEELDIKQINGLYADFGVSSWQLDDNARGFSFRRDGVIDMRMDAAQGESAKDVVNKYSEETLGEIIYRYGEEKFFRRIARAIAARRVSKQFVSTLDLAAVIKKAVPVKYHKHGFHPATQTFQAIRIHVNQELAAIESLLREPDKIIAKGGRIVFISFHSLEDRLVKNYLNGYEHPCICPPEFPLCMCGKIPSFKVLTKKPITPDEKEIKVNPLSRSAKMRVAEKII